MKFSELTKEFTIIDVREPYECAHGMVKNAINIPLNELPNRLGELKGKVAFYCQTGARSAYATIIAKQQGLDAYNLEGYIYYTN